MLLGAYVVLLDAASSPRPLAVLRGQLRLAAAVAVVLGATYAALTAPLVRSAGIAGIAGIARIGLLAGAATYALAIRTTGPRRRQAPAPW